MGAHLQKQPIAASGLFSVTQRGLQEQFHRILTMTHFFYRWVIRITQEQPCQSITLYYSL